MKDLLHHRRFECVSKSTSQLNHVYAHVGCMPEEKRVEFLKKQIVEPPQNAWKLDELRIADIVEQVMRRPEAYSFRKLPDAGLYPQYYTTIRNPISLELITKKLRKLGGQAEIWLFRDLDTLVSNCEIFNGQFSFISQRAQLVRDQILRTIRNMYCRNCGQVTEAQQLTECPICLDKQCDSCGDCICVMWSAHMKAWQAFSLGRPLNSESSGEESPPLTLERFGAFLQSIPISNTGKLAQILAEEQLIQDSPNTLECDIDIAETDIPVLYQRIKHLELESQ
jgi:hypothetical protein